MPNDVPTGSVPWIIGSLAAVVVVLAGVIAYLFRLYNRRIAQHDKQRRESDALHASERGQWIEERAGWEAAKREELAKLELEYVKREKEVTEGYIKQSAHDREQHLAREEQIRRDATALVEKMSQDAAAASTKMADLLQKMHDRFLGGRRR